jgi:PHP family Zn ribbon phosphoesterase
MPWCEPCSRYFAPSALTRAGKCPSCGKAIDVSLRNSQTRLSSLRELSKASGEKAPWHFRLLMTMLVLYLAWRLIAPFVD